MHWEKKLILITNDSAEFLHLQNYPKLSVFKNNKISRSFDFFVAWQYTSIGFGESIQLARANTPFLSSEIIIREILIAAHSTRHRRLGASSSSSLSSHCWAPLSTAILHASRWERGTNKSKISARDIIYRLSNYETISPRGSRDFR